MSVDQSKANWRSHVMDALLGALLLALITALIALSRELSEVRTDLRGLSVATQRDAEDIKVLKEGQKQLLESVHGLALQQGKIEGRLFHLEERVATGFKRVDERADERHTELKALLSGRRR